MDTRYLNLLEYDKFIQILIKYCKTYLGREQVERLAPKFNKLDVINLLSETNEAVSLIYRKSSLPLGDIPSIEIPIKQLESNSTLSAKSLLEVASILKISRELREYFYSDDEFDTNSFPIMSDHFSKLYANKGIEDKIFSIILDENTIADNASNKLASLRRTSRKLEQEIRDKLNSFIHSATYSKYMMDPIITIRNGRFVLPVKEEYKSQVKGFIHDISSSGSTVFIEPMNIFEMNNEIANIKVDENIEIERILQNLSIILYEYSQNLKENLEVISYLDTVFAKASYSIEIQGTYPIVSDDKLINLQKARHPLIDKTTVVPIDISLGKDYSTLVITGPNTGGKTVTLKTVGLILLMAYCGVLIPCKENSTIHVFDNIFADIGDEQSIQESLSTFSSHISNIVKITQNITDNSLILLDELGSGTDPIEGANLAISILQYFHDIGSLVICTTHYQELKNFCLLTDGFENASCEFDVENMKPTYKLLVGIPGKSNAFAISKRLGLKQEILDKASSLMKSDDISIEELMKSIYDNKIEIEKEKENIQKNANQIEMLRKSLEKENTDVKRHEQELIENAKREARTIILSAKDEVNDILHQMNELQNNMNSDSIKNANQLRNKLNDKLQDVNSSNDNGLNLEILKTLNSRDMMKKNTLNKKISPNSSVSFSKNGNYKGQNISSEINVIGLNVDEATFLIDSSVIKTESL